MSVLAGLTPELWRAAGVVFLIGLWLSSRDLPWRWALPVTTLKLAIPVVYFAVEPAGLLHVSDGLDYYHDALALLRQGHGPLDVFSDPFAHLQFREAAGGLHMGYPLWNLAAMAWFGPHYFAPVFLNVALTFVAGWLFARVLREAGFGPGYRLPALVFFLLHWDMLAWSSFLNLKDFWVMTLSLVALWSMLRLSRGARLAADAWRWGTGLVALLAALGALVVFRFYAPLLLLAALLAWLVTGAAAPEDRARRPWPAVAAVVALPAALVAWRGDLVARAAGNLDLWRAPYGALRFLATPLPWQLSPEYRFLLVPATLHLLLLIPALIAVPYLWRRAPRARLGLLYLAVVILFYAAVPGLQGPRQRLQAGFVFVWLQFHALWTLARYVVPEAFNAARERWGGAGSAAS